MRLNAHQPPNYDDTDDYDVNNKDDDDGNDKDDDDDGGNNDNIKFTHLSTVNTRAIFPMARILLRITSFLLIASLCSSSSSPSSSSSVQMLRIFTSISVTENER